jgi:hypothetical protein
MDDKEDEEVFEDIEWVLQPPCRPNSGGLVFTLRFYEHDVTSETASMDVYKKTIPILLGMASLDYIRLVNDTLSTRDDIDACFTAFDTAWGKSKYPALDSINTVLGDVGVAPKETSVDNFAGYG